MRASFGLVAVSRHPLRRADVAVRYAREWKPPKGGLIRFGTPGEPETPRGDLDRLIKAHNVVAVVADPYQLHAMLTELRDEGRVYAKAFDQGRDRLEADAQFRQLIINRRIAHDGNAALSEHVKNANIAVDAQSRKLRIVKREQSLKIDLAVCASMAAYEALHGFPTALTATATNTNWAASTAYVVGDYRARGGYLYFCTHGGTSAGSGGPTTTDRSILDGTVVWTYAGADNGYVVDRRLKRYSVRFASEGGANAVINLRLISIRATGIDILPGGPGR